MALGALEPGASISLKELMCELNQKITDVEAVFSSLGLQMKNALYPGAI